jgi:hypothetical protein
VKGEHPPAKNLARGKASMMTYRVKKELLSKKTDQKVKRQANKSE